MSTQVEAPPWWVQLAAATGDERARLKQVVMDQHVSLLWSVASRICRTNRHVERAELVSDGAFGLADAIEKYSPDHKTKFTTYATLRIRGAMLDAIRNRDWVPRQERRSGRRIKHVGSLSVLMAKRDFRHGNGYEPPVPMPDVREWNFEDWDALRQLTRGLPSVMRSVLHGYYGRGWTMKQIGRELELSESRISQLHSLALGILRSRATAPSAQHDVNSERWNQQWATAM